MKVDIFDSEICSQDARRISRAPRGRDLARRLDEEGDGQEQQEGPERPLAEHRPMGVG